MKILVVASMAESLINFRGPLIRALLNKGLEVHACAPEGSSSEKVRSDLELLGAKLHSISLCRTGMNPVTDLIALISLYRLMRRIHPDVVLGYTIKPVVYGTLAASLAGVPKSFVLITGLGYAFTGEARGVRARVKAIAQWLYKLVLARAHKVFFQNPDDESLFRSLGLLTDSVPSVVVNGSGIDLASFNVVPIPEGPPKFLLIARLLGDKGVREYAEAAKLVRKRYPQTRFFLVGWIDENPNAISQSELGEWIKSGAIEYLGRISDVRGAIANCTVYVLPSYREGTPRTVLEAMAMGRPVITTDAPGCRETVLDGQNGFLVPIKAVEPLVNAMTSFIEDGALATSMGQRSRELAELKYDVNKVNAVMLSEMKLC